MNPMKIVSVILLLSVFMSLLCMPAYAEEDIILISPGPTAAEGAAGLDADAFLQKQYEKTAGMYAYDGVAAQLYSIGVLLGDGVNFNLEQIPDRQQACVMVVRMRGEEAAALAAYEAGEISCPFTDVTDEWAKPYLAWLYEKEIVLGVGEGQFGNSECTAQMYVTFMLRALGYTVAWSPDSGWPDVFYADVLDFARSLCLWDTCLDCEPVFHRGVMSAVTYQTLAAEVRGSEERLLSVLTKAGAVDAGRAQPILDLFDRVDAAAALGAVPTAGNGLQAAGVLSHDAYRFGSADSTAEGGTAVYSGKTFDFGLDLTEGRQSIALDGVSVTRHDGTETTQQMGMWLCDGTVYFDVMGQKQCADVSAAESLEWMTSEFGVLSLLLENTAYRYYAVTDVYTRTPDAGGTVIVCDTTDFMWPVIAAQLDIGDSDPESALSALVTAEKYIGENGVLSGVSCGMYAGICATDGQSGIPFRSEALVQTTVTYTAWGEDVILSFPDLSQIE